MKVLFIGGTGIISTACVELAVARGLDLTVLNRVEARQQREQRALPSPVETEQNCESRGRDRDVNVVESLARAIRMADALDGDGRRLDGVHSVHYGPRRA